MKNANLSVGLQLFIDKGYQAVSIRKIADKNEFSSSTIYLFFEDKDAIFFEHNDIRLE